MMSKVPEMFGSLVFNDTVMQERLPKATYNALKETRDHGKPQRCCKAFTGLIASFFFFTGIQGMLTL